MIRKSVVLFVTGLMSVVPTVLFSGMVSGLFWFFNHTVGIAVFAIFFCIFTGVSLEKYGQIEVAKMLGSVNEKH